MLGTDVLDKDMQICIKESTKNKLEKLARRQYMDVDTFINAMLRENEELRHQAHLQQLEGNFAKSKVNKKNATNVPSIIRHQFGIQPGDTLLWDLLDGQIVIRKEQPKED